MISRQGAKKRKENKSLHLRCKNLATNPDGLRRSKPLTTRCKSVCAEHYFRTIPPRGGKFRVSLYILCSSSTSSLRTSGLKTSPVPQYFLSLLLKISFVNSFPFTNTSQLFLTTVVRFKITRRSSSVFLPF